MAYLVLIRHGQTEWNALGLFSGQTDVPLNELGIQQAQKAADLLQDIAPHAAYTSTLQRAKATLSHILHGLQNPTIPVTSHDALLERNYGIYEGKSKHDAIKEHGKEAIHQLRRAWDHPVPQGESLKDVSERVIPYFESHIMADIKAGKNVFVSSHNNVIRALIAYLEKLTPEEIAQLELKNASLTIFSIDTDGTIIEKITRHPDIS